MTVSTTRAGLPELLARVAEACRGHLAAHIEETRPDLRFQRPVLFAVAALESASMQHSLDDVEIRLVRKAASDAAGVCRTERPDDAMHAVVARMEEAVTACDGILGEGAPPDQTLRWQRFLFADADVVVSREGRTWRVRGEVGERASRLLDIALEDLAPLSGHRIAELTVQILAWYAHEDSSAKSRGSA